MTPWLRAGAYFCVCLAVGAVSGVLGDLLDGTGDPSSWAVVGCLLLELLAYGVIWPIGTFTQGRPRTWVSPVFGAVWGFCEGLLLLSGFVAVDRLGLSTPWTVALAFVLLSAFQGLWHALYWDVRVAPPHNVPEWNLRKVLLCHVPNLVATLSLYAATGSALWFVACQVLSLALCSAAMRFPRPSWTPTPA